MMDGLQKMIDSKDCGGDDWWDGFAMAVLGHTKASA
jgi:hypothetical protein